MDKGKWLLTFFHFKVTVSPLIFALEKIIWTDFVGNLLRFHFVYYLNLAIGHRFRDIREKPRNHFFEFIRSHTPFLFSFFIVFPSLIPNLKNINFCLLYIVLTRTIFPPTLKGVESALRSPLQYTLIPGSFIPHVINPRTFGFQIPMTIFIFANHLYP